MSCSADLYEKVVSERIFLICQNTRLQDRIAGFIFLLFKKPGFFAGSIEAAFAPVIGILPATRQPVER